MYERKRIVDMADRVMTYARDRSQRDFAEYLRDRILERIASGRSTDCDEYRALYGMDTIVL